MSTFNKGLVQVYENSISGIWNSLGCVPKNEDNLVVFLQDSPEGSGSLINLCGFDDSQIKSIGALKDIKTISELVVMIPHLKEEYRVEPLPLLPETTTEENCLCPEKDPCGETIEPEQDKNKYFSDGLVYCKTENSYLFTFEFDHISKYFFTGSSSGSYEGWRKETIQQKRYLLDNNPFIDKQNDLVYKLMYSMLEYNIPPHLNWMLFENIPLYSFYVSEFSANLSKQDLSNIWQGTMPSIAQNPEQEEIMIEHELNDNSIFAFYDIAEISQKYDLKLKVFKCKKRAKNAFYKDNLKSTRVFRPDPPWYQYNWPYDYFSLVELLKIEGWEERDYSFEKPEYTIRREVAATTNRG